MHSCAQSKTCFSPYPQVLELLGLCNVRTFRAALPFMNRSCLGLGILRSMQVDDCRNLSKYDSTRKTQTAALQDGERPGLKVPS